MRENYLYLHKTNYTIFSHITQTTISVQKLIYAYIVHIKSV